MSLRLAKNRRTCPIVATRDELAQLFDTTPHFIADAIANKSLHYGYFEIPKANGEMRVIQPPYEDLKFFQHLVLEYLYQRLRIPTYLHGGVPRRSAISHARPHVGKYMVATLDIRRFYPSTQHPRILPVLEDAGFVEDAKSDLVELLTLDGSLPQGAPTSCLLANLAFVPVDHPLRKVCRRHGLIFTRFVDDIAISGGADFRQLKGTFTEIINSTEYEIATEKTAFSPQCSRQVVTGLVVNEKLRPTREFISELKHDIHLCRREGPGVLAEAEGEEIATVKRRINGRVAHVAQCDKKLGKKLRRLLYDIPWREEPATAPR